MLLQTFTSDALMSRPSLTHGFLKNSGRAFVEQKEGGLPYGFPAIVEQPQDDIFPSTTSIEADDSFSKPVHGEDHGDNSMLTKYELEAAMRAGKLKMNRSKITVVGPGRGGKTCLARSLLDLKFEDTPSTQGMNDFGLRNIVHYAEAKGGRWRKFREFEKLFESFMARYIHDQRLVQKLHTQNAASDDHQDKLSLSTRALEMLTYLLDLVASVLSFLFLFLKFSDRTNSRLKRVPTIETLKSQSALSDNQILAVDEDYVRRAIGEIKEEGSGLVVSIHDFGGQKVFDVIHSFFLGPNGVYIIVFNMEWMLSDYMPRCVEYIKSWLRAIVVHSSTIRDKDNRIKCATVAIVGTHKDKVPNLPDHRYISQKIEDLLATNIAWRSLLENSCEGLCFFPVDCTQGQADPTMVNLMTVIEKDILQSDYVNVERPLTYFKALDKMIERRRSASYISLEEVFDIANEFNVGSLSLQIEMIRFFRNLGLIMWNEEPSLRDIMILDPVEFFVSPATNVVCQLVPDEQGTAHMNDVLRAAKRKFPLDFKKLMEKSVITTSLLKFILDEHFKREFTDEKRSNRSNRVDAVQNLMVKHSLIVAMFGDIVEDDFSVKVPREYLVPSLLRSPDVSDSLNLRSLCFHCSIETSIDLVSTLSELRERGFLPPGLFQRVVAKVLTEVDGTRGGNYEFLHRDQVWFFIGHTKLTITARYDLGAISVEFGEGAVYGPLKLLTEVLEEVKSESFMRLEVAVMAPLTKTSEVIEEFIRLDLLSNQKHNFMIGGTVYRVDELKNVYSAFLEPNIESKPFDVFISYKWSEQQKRVARTFYSMLGRVLIPEDNNRPLRVYLDEKENNYGDNFAKKICSAFRGLKVFLPLICENVLLRMKTHDPSKPDYVLAEWIIVLATKPKILPILVGKAADDGSHWEPLNIEELKKEQPDIYPKETISFVKRWIGEVGLSNLEPFDDSKMWTVKRIVESIFENLYLEWSNRACIRISRERVLKVVEGALHK